MQGTGNGHITRSRLIVRALAECGAAVDVLVSGRAADAVPTFDGAASVTHRVGLSFVVEAGQLSKTKTVTQLKLAQFVSDVRSLDLKCYDQLITDYEPVTAWAAKLRKRRSIGIGHQYAFGEGTPLAKSDLASRLVMRCFAPVSVGLGLHWAHYHGNVLPPVVDVATLNRAAPSGVTVVYLPWEDTAAVTAALNGIPDRRFHQYCHVDVATEIGNVTLCPISYTGFKADLCAADAVICNAGFELVSEALHLGVPCVCETFGWPT